VARALLSRFADEFVGAKPVRTFILLSAAMLAIATSASADPIPGGAGDFSGGFGMGWESFDSPINTSTRDENGNRVIVNGRMEIEGTLTGGLQDSFSGGIGSAQAIGNQLNVVTQGNYNTVIVDSTQINNGDITAVIGDD
jgi:holdfast attachment protein HfaA